MYCFVIRFEHKLNIKLDGWRHHEGGAVDTGSSAVQFRALAGVIVYLGEGGGGGGEWKYS